MKLSDLSLTKSWMDGKAIKAIKAISPERIQNKNPDVPRTSTQEKVPHLEF